MLKIEERQYQRGKEGDCVKSNPCPTAKPFLCRSHPRTCIGLRFVCDGTPDCDDGFDEEKGLCNAAVRPSFDDLLFFVENEIRWMGPKFFNGADPELVAHALTVASDMQDLSETLGMTPENENLLRTAFEAALEGDERPLQDMGMPDRSWHEVHYVLQKLMDSGFKF
ncbi:prohormone-4 [Elysia marginata]|uniref:Prohormone-4 n=1 Tax=Elysia marginata TaxID=1093978 RepID=A0AAV4FR12_9GAST|nr:prohormone-4 [Elysia marginata]